MADSNTAGVIGEGMAGAQVAETVVDMPSGEKDPMVCIITFFLRLSHNTTYLCISYSYDIYIRYNTHVNVYNHYHIW